MNENSKPIEDVKDAESQEALMAELLEAAEEVFKGWYADTNRVEWEDFFDRLESSFDEKFFIKLGSNGDMGSDMNGGLCLIVKRHIAKYRRL